MSFISFCCVFYVTDNNFFFPVIGIIDHSVMIEKNPVLSA